MAIRSIFLIKPPDRLGEKNGKIITENDDFVVFYLPGRTVYVSAESGSQYQQAEYYLLKKGRAATSGNGYWAEEILRFPRSI